MTTAVQHMGGPGEASDSIDSLTSLVFHEHIIGPEADPLPETVADACQPGTLTDTGVKQHEALGRFFRQAYVLTTCLNSAATSGCCGGDAHAGTGADAGMWTKLASWRLSWTRTTWRSSPQTTHAPSCPLCPSSAACTHRTHGLQARARCRCMCAHVLWMRPCSPPPGACCLRVSVPAAHRVYSVTLQVAGPHGAVCCHTAGLPTCSAPQAAVRCERRSGV